MGMLLDVIMLFCAEISTVVLMDWISKQSVSKTLRAFSDFRIPTLGAQRIKGVHLNNLDLPPCASYLTFLATTHSYTRCPLLRQQVAIFSYFQHCAL